MTDANDSREEVLRLFLKHQVMLSSFLYSLVEDWEIAEEALQESAVFICSRWQDFTPGTNFGAWARTVARMRCREVLQRRRRTVGSPLESVIHNLAEPISDNEWDQHCRFSPRYKEALAQCLNILPAEHRRLVELRYQEQEPCERIAALFAKGVEAIYMMLSRIRKRLKQCVEHRLAQEVP